MNQRRTMGRQSPSVESVRRASYPLVAECGSISPVLRPHTGQAEGTADRLLGYYYGLSRFAALPLTIWLSYGWFGLLCHCYASKEFTFLFEKPAQSTDLAVHPSRPSPRELRLTR